ncbi:hypothetical protein ACIBI7_33470 [Nonomuraea fuscirosea]|uniref:hypothetical protein n=1 Tax=Nonomuraea fuscirosea TaxID=1291556 RepID=UPI0037A6B0BD
MSAGEARAAPAGPVPRVAQSRSLTATRCASRCPDNHGSSGVAASACQWPSRYAAVALRHDTSEPPGRPSSSSSTAGGR